MRTQLADCNFRGARQAAPLYSPAMDLQVRSWAGYELVAAGDGRKLERFGGVLLDRPAPQAIWPAPAGAPWDRAEGAFQRGEGGGGDWRRGGAAAADGWRTAWRDLDFEIRPTGFGNVGLFPEHAAHWIWLQELLRPRAGEAEVLNLFAYTGGATLAAARAGASVTHVDAARAVNEWARLNARRSGLEGAPVRYLADDALKFVRREARRGRRYDLLVIDPPTFGRGAKGEVWKIERDLQALLAACGDLLGPAPLGLLLTAHSPGVTPAVLRGLLAPLRGRVQAGEMLLAGGPEAGPPLPAGVYARWGP